MRLRKVTINESKIILQIYKAVIGTKYCVWDNEYPTLFEINHDIETNNLFVYENEFTNEIIGAISIVSENEFDDLSLWKVKEKVLEIARVVIKPEYQGNNYSYQMVESTIEMIKKLSYNAIHLAVEVNNIPAYKTYKKLGFDFVGKSDMFGHHYYLCEMILN